MKRLDVGCERCGDIGKQRWIRDLTRPLNQISVFLCKKCNKDLMQADADAWAWFRKYRDRIDAAG
ncbi:MAG: hypothetical protein WBY93_00125 [Candidatus Binatus sp.]